jgi:chromosome segregation ATPase
MQAELQTSMQEREEWLTDIQCLRAKERRLYEDGARLKAELERCAAELEGLRCRNGQLEKDNAELTEQNVQVRRTWKGHWKHGAHGKCHWGFIFQITSGCVHTC